MTLPSSGAISFSMIAGEFGGSTPHSINEYYRGGANVPNSSVNNSIPTSGQISLNSFYGGSAVSPDPYFSFTVQSYTINSGKVTFNYYGANNSMSDGSVVTNNGNSYTVTDCQKIQGAGFDVFIYFSGSGNAYNAYNTGGVRGLRINGTTYPIATPAVGAISVGFTGSGSADSYFSSNVGSSITLQLTY